MKAPILVFFMLLFSFVYSQQTLLDSAKTHVKNSEYYEAEQVYHKWLSNNKNHKDYYRIQLNFAEVKRLLHKYDEVFGIYIKMEEETKDSLREIYLNAIINRADLSRNTYDLDESKRIFRSINFSSQEIELYPNLLCKFYHRRAATYNESDVLDTALLYSYQSLKISEANHFEEAQATSYNEIANIYEKQHLLDSAILYYDKACHIWLENDNLRYYSNGYFNRARVFIHLNQYDSAIYHLKANLNLIKNKNWPEVKGPIYYHIGEAYSLLGDSLNSLKYRMFQAEEIIKLKDKEYENDIYKVKSKYEAKEKDKQIEFDQLKIEKQETELKNKQNNLLILTLVLGFTLIIAGLSIYYFLSSKKKNKQLTKLLKENEFLLGESNHRIKNNLQLITSLLHRDLEKEEGGNSNIIAEALGKIEAISTLHKQLYTNESKETINLKKYISDIEANFSLFFQKQNITPSIKVENFELNIQQSTYLGLLITELFINSIKHAFRNTDTPTIYLNITLKQTYLVVEYNDNGTGFNPKTTTPKLVELLCKQLKGEYNFFDENGFALRLKISI